MSFFALDATTVVKVFFAGLWPVVWHLLGWFALCLVGIAWAIWSPVKKSWGVFFAVLVASVLISYGVALKLGADRCAAQIKILQAAAITGATEAGKQGARDADSSKCDPQDTDCGSK